MKIGKKENVEEVIGVQESIQFKINEKNSQKIVSYLIDLYSDPIGSTVREIASNSLDAHKERDLKLSNKISLEEEDNPKYWSDRNTVEIEYIASNKIIGIESAMVFKDWGVGMSYERLKEVYISFGESTKSQNNYEIGGFGLGAKSPLSYTETFYVNTRHNGKEYLYMIYRGNNDIPYADKIYEKDTLNLNGTEVIIPFKDKNDHPKFLDAINRQLLFFDNVIYNGVEENLGKIYKPDILKEADSYNVISNQEIDSCILVGNVMYPIDWNILTPSLNLKYRKGYNLRYQHDNSLRKHLCFKFKIGELDLVPSREAIRYTKNTISIIKDAILKLIEKFKEESIEEFNSEKDYLKWLISLIKLDTNDRGYYYYQNTNFVRNLLSIKGAVSGISHKDLTFNNDKDSHVSSMHSILGNSGFLSCFDIKLIKLVSDHRSATNKRVSYLSINSIQTLARIKDDNVYLCKDRLSYKKNYSKAEEGDFIVFKIRDNFDSYCSDNNISLENKLRAIKIKNWVLQSSLLKDYNDIKEKEVSPDSLDLLTNQERRALNKLVFFRESYVIDDYSIEVKFANKETKLKDYVSYGNDIVYGFSDDEHLLKIYKLMLYNNATIKNIKNYKVIKIAKNAASDFNHLTYVKDLFANENDKLINFLTAHHIFSKFSNIDCLGSFKYICKEYYDKYNVLNEYLKKHYSYLLRNTLKLTEIKITKNKIESVLSLDNLCYAFKDHLVTDKVMIFNDCLNYCDGLDLLFTHVHDLNSEVRKKSTITFIKRNLEILNKKVDKSSVNYGK